MTQATGLTYEFNEAGINTNILEFRPERDFISDVWNQYVPNSVSVKILSD